MRWHRRIGAGVAAVVLIVTATGIVLNHSAGLGLDRHTTQAPWLLALYERAPDGPVRGYRVGAAWLVWLEGQLVLDGRVVAENMDEIVGARRAGGMVVAAAPEEILLLTPEGAVVERLTGAALPGRIERIGVVAEGRVAVRTPDGQYTANEQLLGWRPSRQSADWAAAAPPPEEVRAAALAAYRGAGVPWSRVLLDVHSGRILGAWGPLLVDAMALGLLFLAGTGFWYWLRTKR